MKAIRKLSDDQLRILISLQTGKPENLAMDDVMTLGGNGLVEFAKSGGIKLTKKGQKAVGIIERP
jgi:hypothetical protein